MRTIGSIIIIGGLSIGLTLLGLTHAANAGVAEQSTDEALPTVQLDHVDEEAKLFSDVLADLAARGHLNLAIDKQAMEAAGVNLAAPITLHLKNVTLSAALDWVLAQAESNQHKRAPLDYRFEHGILTISTAERMSKTTVVRTYDIRDLMDQEIIWLKTAPPMVLPNGTVVPTQEAFTGKLAEQEMEKLIEQSNEPDSWREMGGPTGTMNFMAGQRLIVRHTPAVQRQVAALLDRLRRPLGPPFPVSPARTLAAPLKPEAALEKMLDDVDLEHTTLGEALDGLGKLCGWNVTPDWKTLERAGMPADAKINVHLHHVTAAHALNVVTACAGREGPVSFALDGGTLRIFIDAAAGGDTSETRVYDVQQLLAHTAAAIAHRHGQAPGADSGNPLATASVSTHEAGDELCKIIQSTITSATWSDGGVAGGKVQVFADKLIVTTTPTAQAQVADLLKKLADPQEKPAGH